MCVVWGSEFELEALITIREVCDFRQRPVDLKYRIVPSAAAPIVGLKGHGIHVKDFGVVFKSLESVSTSFGDVESFSIVLAENQRFPLKISG
jgi:hypothetical protein